MRVHWYLLVFQHSDMSGTTIVNHYIGRSVPYVTFKGIEEAKKSAGCPERAITISCSYLGHMTEDEIRNAD